MILRLFISIIFLGHTFTAHEQGMKLLKVIKGLGWKEVNIGMSLDPLCFDLMKLSAKNYPLVVNCGKHQDFGRNEQVNFITTSLQRVLDLHQKSIQNMFYLTTIYVATETADYLPDQLEVNSTFGFFHFNLGKLLIWIQDSVHRKKYFLMTDLRFH